MKKQSNGFTLVELLVVIGILGILMGALFPAISSAMLAAQTSAMSMRGRNLFVAITQCNTEREAAGLASVWPQQTPADTSGSSDDIAAKAATTSTDFFNYLFSMKGGDVAYGDKDWQPYVNVDIGVVSGAGVPGLTGKEFKQENVAWFVAKNVKDELADVVPVLVSRNVERQAINTNMRSYNGTSTDKVKMGVGGGIYQVPFGNKAWVLIRKGGAAAVIKAKYSRLDVIFNRQGFDNGENPPEFMDL